MTFIRTVRPADAAGDVRDMYERQEEYWGYVPNYAKAFSHRPEALARWGRLLAELRRPTDDRRFELVTFVVDRIYNKAIQLGGADEGAPGLRAEGGDGFYAAYFRDLDGNKLDVFSYG